MNENYLETLKILSNKRRVKAFVRELSVDQIEIMLTSLQEASAERIADLEVSRAKEAEHKEKINSYIEMMKQDGIDVSDFLEASQDKKEVKEKAPRAKKEPKYEYHKNGEVAFWTGQGRTPKVIEQALKNGQVLEDFLIK